MYLVSVDTNKCTGCGECTEACPANILEVTDGTAEVVGEDCLGCESCVAVCPAEAVSVQEL
ncbi:4Fe-4S binding protein [Calderihabitans maritimus]|uniref:Ferredoxin n=1 Tax=Calderihabitans maritimus TaxID=1246530 RepID=A0A1Z5HR24_9FIRM|nr:4Fe-4S binding protein [Calderihabitans maritimus]GAW91765.1 ferredoxin [Calderihabitans maritimus]